MAKTVNSSNLAEAIAAELEGYRQEVTDGLKESIRKTSKKTVKSLKKTSPKGSSGKYAKGWKDKVEHENSEDIFIVIHNKNKPQLIHLLEDGHELTRLTKYGYAKVGGGRVEGIPHVMPAEKAAEKELMNQVKVVVSRKWKE